MLTLLRPSACSAPVVAACAAFFLTAEVPAQLLRVGPTQAFLTIQAAVNQASISGEQLILVDPGPAYAGFTVSANNNLAILSSNPAQRYTLAPNPAAPVVSVIAIGGGQSVTIGNFQTTVTSGATSVVSLLACSGEVKFEDIGITPAANLLSVPMRGLVDMLACNSVTFFDSQIGTGGPAFDAWTTNNSVFIRPALGWNRGVSAMVVDASRVHIQECTLRGYDNNTAQVTTWAGDGLRLMGNSAASIDDPGTNPVTTNLIAGSTSAAGGYGGSGVHHVGTLPPGSPVVACGFVGSTAGGGAFPGGVYGINHDQGVVGGASRLLPACIPSTSGWISAPRRVSINTNFNATAFSFFQKAYAIYIAPTTPFQTIPGFANPNYLNQTSPLTFLLAFGPAMNVAGPGLYSAPAQFTVPNIPSLYGYQFGTQAAFGPPFAFPGQPAGLSMLEITTVVP